MLSVEEPEWDPSDIAAPTEEPPARVRVEISYRVRLSDLVWMYLGSWAARMMMSPGLVLLVAGLSGLATPDAPSANTAARLVVAGAALAVLGPAFYCFGMIHGISHVRGTTVHLTIDDDGVSGWPIASDMDRSWPRIRRARKLGGVLTLPFRQLGTRAGWVPVPERAMTPGQLQDLLGLLAYHGLM